MAREKCNICSSEIEKGFMDKIIGTVIKIKDGDSFKVYFVCSLCQKQYGNDLRSKLES